MYVCQLFSEFQDWVNEGRSYLSTLWFMKTCALQSQDQIVWSSAENTWRLSLKNITVVTQVTVCYIWPARLSYIWAFWGSQFTRIGKSERDILCQLLYVSNLLCTLNACGATPFEWDSSKVCKFVSCSLPSVYSVTIKAAGSLFHSVQSGICSAVSEISYYI